MYVQVTPVIRWSRGWWRRWPIQPPTPRKRTTRHTPRLGALLSEPLACWNPASGVWTSPAARCFTHRRRRVNCSSPPPSCTTTRVWGSCRQQLTTASWLAMDSCSHRRRLRRLAQPPPATLLYSCDDNSSTTFKQCLYTTMSLFTTIKTMLTNMTPSAPNCWSSDVQSISAAANDYLSVALCQSVYSQQAFDLTWITLAFKYLITKLSKNQSILLLKFEQFDWNMCDLVILSFIYMVSGYQHPMPKQQCQSTEGRDIHYT